MDETSIPESIVWLLLVLWRCSVVSFKASFPFVEDILAGGEVVGEIKTNMVTVEKGSDCNRKLSEAW